MMSKDYFNLSNSDATTRRTLLKAGGALLLAVCAPGISLASEIVAVRCWPADEYTRVTFESDRELKTSHFILRDPARLVVDIEGVDLSAHLTSLIAKIQPNDPYIQQVRVGQNKPNVVRLVFDLKAEINPQVFTLSPFGGFRHRLMFDIYPVSPKDAISELINQDRAREAESAQAAESNVPDQAAPRPQPRMDVAKKNVRPVVVMIDPGHGGEDPGAIGRRGTREKDVVLAIAKKLQGLINRQPNMRALLTRESDYFVPLNARVQKARRAKADLFVSIHADAWIKPTARGSSVFALSERGASSTSARWLARKENAADLIGGINIKTKDRQLSQVLLDLTTTAQIKDSMKVGSAILREMGRVSHLHKDEVENAGFAVLKAPDIPSILIETAFISNPEEERKLRTSRHQDQIAEAVFHGIQKYFAANPPLARHKVA